MGSPGLFGTCPYSHFFKIKDQGQAYFLIFPEPNIFYAEIEKSPRKNESKFCNQSGLCWDTIYQFSHL